MFYRMIIVALTLIKKSVQISNVFMMKYIFCLSSAITVFIIFVWDTHIFPSIGHPAFGTTTQRPWSTPLAVHVYSQSPTYDLRLPCWYLEHFSKYLGVKFGMFRKNDCCLVWGSLMITVESLWWKYLFSIDHTEDQCNLLDHKIGKYIKR